MDRIITTISLFSVIAYRITPSVNRIASALHNINTTEFIFRDEQFLKDLRPADEQQESAVSFTGQISLDNVSFHYPGEGLNVLQGCNIHIQKGERVGVIGSSGAGKSTLVKLLLGYLQPTAGSVLIDGKKLDDATMRGWWQLLGYVRQDVYIINASLAENIALGVPAAEVDNAKAATCHQHFLPAGVGR